MFHQKPFLLVHQDIILCKPCPFSFLRFRTRSYQWKVWYRKNFLIVRNSGMMIKPSFIDIVSCGFSIIGNDDHITATDGMTFEVLRSLLLQACFNVSRSFPRLDSSNIHLMIVFYLDRSSFAFSVSRKNGNGHPGTLGVSFYLIYCTLTCTHSLSSSSSSIFIFFQIHKKNLIAFITHA